MVLYSLLFYCFKMPYKRMVPSRRPRRAYMPPTTYRPKEYVSRSRMGMPNQQELFLKRKFFFTNWSPNNVTTEGFWRYFAVSLVDLQSASDITNLFDTYQIKALKWDFVPRFTDFPGNDNTGSGVQNAAISASVIVDPYSTTSPSGLYNATTYNTFCEQGDVKTHNGIRPFSVYYKPTVPSTLWNEAGASVPGRRVVSPVIQTSQLTIDHFGFHMFLHNINFSSFPAPATQTFDVYCTMYLRLKHTK